jgi:hypothetical protein
MPTAYQHYNNLRADALRFGHSESDAANLGQLLGRYEENLKLERLETDRVRVPASAAAPAALVISGVPLLALNNVDLPLGSRPNGSPGDYYLFAVRSPGSAAFSLDCNTQPEESSNRRLIGRFYWDGTQIAPHSLRTERTHNLVQQLDLVFASVCEGRLTAQSGEGLPAVDIPSSDRVYFTPYLGNRVSLYVPGLGWRLHTFDELSASLAGKTGDRNQDVFLFDHAGILELELVQWSADVNRSAALALQDGVLVKDSSPQKRYLGTLRVLPGGGATCDTGLKRFVWNCRNRDARPLLVKETADNWTYSTAAFRPFNNSLANRVEFVTGLSEAEVYLDFAAVSRNSAGTLHSVGIGLDSVNQQAAELILCNALNAFQHCRAAYKGRPTAGYHFLQLLEWGGGSTTTFYGDANSPTLAQSAALGYVTG